MQLRGGLIISLFVVLGFGVGLFAFSSARKAWNRWHKTRLLAEATDLARSIAHGPTFAHAMTKNQLHQEWDMGVDEAIEAEAQAQAICMQTEDFARAFRAFAAREKPVFEGN